MAEQQLIFKKRFPVDVLVLFLILFRSFENTLLCLLLFLNEHDVT